MAHIILLYLLILYTADTVTPLTTDDFYTDDSAPAISVLTTQLESSWYNLPISIYNIKKSDSQDPVIRIRHGGGYLVMQRANNHGTLLMDVLYSWVINDGESILKFSTDPTLLAKAHKDLSMYGVTPTHLIIQTNNNIKSVTSTTGSIFQTVLATNGQYTYAIIQFVQVEPYVGDSPYYSTYIDYFNKATVPLPYASDKVNAATNSNVGVPGKYVIDMNGCRPCKEKMLRMTCEANKKLNRTVYSYCP